MQFIRLCNRKEFETLQAARKCQRTPEFRALHALRARVEAALSQGVRGFGLRRIRYVGLAKIRLQHFAIAAAIELGQDRQMASVPIAPTRRSYFGQHLNFARSA